MSIAKSSRAPRRPVRQARPNFAEHAGSRERIAQNEKSLRAMWWMWPHLLSVDAPLVAVVWLRWWALAAHVTVPWGCMGILGAGVWLIYVADRLADTASPSRRDHETARHAFYGRERRLIVPVAGAMFFGLAFFSLRLLPGREFVAGLGLVGLAIGYFWLIHRATAAGWARTLPKEGVVAGMFAAGTAFFVVDRTGCPDVVMLAAYAMFGGLCFFNCAFITRWEQTPRDVQETSSLLNAFPRLTAHLGAGCLGLGLLAATAVYGGHERLFLPILLSALLLAMLDWCKDRLSVNVLRVLADAALLTPWLCEGLFFSA